MRRSPTRWLIVLSTVLTASLLAVQPVAAFQETKNTGTTAPYQITDEQFKPGTACIFEQNPGELDDELDRIEVKKFHSHAPFMQDSLVGFRFVIQRNTPPHNDNIFEPFYTSSIVKKPANQKEVAFFGPRSWTAPENTVSRFRVRVILYYYAMGSSTNVIGEVRGLMEVYRHRQPGNSMMYNVGNTGAAGWCRREFH